MLKEFIKWYRMRKANERSALTKGSFFLPADDNAILEKLLYEMHADPDTNVTITTSQGTVIRLSLHQYENKKTTGNRWE